MQVFETSDKPLDGHTSFGFHAYTSRGIVLLMYTKNFLFLVLKILKTFFTF